MHRYVTFQVWRSRVSPRVVCCLFAVLSLIALATSTKGAEKLFDFSKEPLNSLPSGFKSRLVGTGPLGEWKVVDTDAPPPTALPSLSARADRKYSQRVLAQTSTDTTDERFPILTYEGEVFEDFTFTTRLRIVGGNKEQMAGVVFRFQDEKNYYYVRASAQSGTLYFFKVENGVRSAPIGSRVEVKAGTWYELGIECRGNRIKVSWNGKEGIPMMTDKSFLVGRIGFLTKSDAISQFAETRMVYKPKEILAQIMVREMMEKYDKRLEEIRIYSKPEGEQDVKIVAASKATELGKPGTDLEKDVITRSKIYHSKISATVTMTLPLHDANGDSIAAVRVVMKSFPGETEKTAITRAMPIIKEMESRVRRHTDLVN